jgi:hypothetical protein
MFPDTDACSTFHNCLYIQTVDLFITNFATIPHAAIIDQACPAAHAYECCSSGKAKARRMAHLATPADMTGVPQARRDYRAWKGRKGCSQLI